MNDEWPRGDPRDVVRAIVADPRYHLHARASAPTASWFDALVNWVGAFIRRLLHGLDRALGAHNRLEAGIGFVVMAAAFALLGFAIYRLVRSLLSAARGKARDGSSTAALGVAPASGELRAAARAAARSGRYRDAAALLFLAAVRTLDERGRIAYDPARTPGEYRRLVREPLFDTFAGDAVAAVFAAADPPGEVFDRMSATYDRFFEERPPATAP